MTSETDIYGLRISDDALRAAYDVPSPMPTQHDVVSSYALRCLMKAAPLVVAAELERIAGSIDPVPDTAADVWMKAEASGRRDVRRTLLARAKELRARTAE